MAKKRSGLRLRVTGVQMRIPKKQILPPPAVNRIGRLVAEESKRIIEDRLDRGEFPLGGNPYYSTEELKIPMITDGSRGPTYDSAWNPIASRILASAQSNPRQYGSVHGERKWVTFMDGYRQFRQDAGLPASIVDLAVTGKMREDMYAHWTMQQQSGEIEVAAGKRRKVAKNKVLVTMNFELRWRTLASEMVAHYIETNNKSPRLFGFWTQQEQNQIRDILEQYLTRYSELNEPWTGGRFRPVRL